MSNTIYIGKAYEPNAGLSWATCLLENQYVVQMLHALNAGNVEKLYEFADALVDKLYLDVAVEIHETGFWVFVNLPSEGDGDEEMMEGYKLVLSPAGAANPDKVLKTMVVGNHEAHVVDMGDV